MNRLEELLLELKDTSEFMVDLAYSSLIYDNEEIAEEVIFLADTMGDLSLRIQELVVEIGMSKPEEIARIVVAIRLQASIMSIAEAAKSIADVVLRGLGKHPVLAMSIKESETTITLAKVAEDSVLKGKTFAETRLSTNCGMFVIAIKREREYIFGPGRSTKIEVGDILIAKGPEEGVPWFKDLADGTDKDLPA
ncbi:MAG: potassium channel protein [Methanomassiliicoccaceae archaeon]|nr:potassium channel protein [Methanomassiliicoccaceae archaeon]